MAKLDGISDESETESPSLSLVEKNYIASVMKEVISNGTLNSCDSANVSSSREDDIVKLARKIYELSGIFYFVSNKKKILLTVYNN